MNKFLSYEDDFLASLKRQEEEFKGKTEVPAAHFNV